MKKWMQVLLSTGALALLMVALAACTGETGPTGGLGAGGPAGLAGPQGDIGPIGPAGLQGDVGPTGPIGATGAQGLAGQPGTTTSDAGHVHAGGTYVANASDFVSAADWDTMQTVRVEMGEFSFSPENLTFEVGKPYKLEIVNVGAVKHYFTAEAFYQSVAFRKAQTSEGEFKAPYFKAIEVFPGDQVDLYFVPVIPGSYDSICTIAGHEEAGMHGNITVTGSIPVSPAPIIVPVADGDWVQNASDLVSAADWDTMQTVRVEMGEFSFAPENLTFEVGKPYKLEIVNVGAVKHYFTAEAFYQSVAFRKAQDSSGEIKAPYFRAVEIFPGEQADLYLIPAIAGSYDSICTITGHEEAGMHGNITVTSS